MIYKVLIFQNIKITFMFDGYSRIYFWLGLKIICYKQKFLLKQFIIS